MTETIAEPVETLERTSYSERMEAFPDINEDLEAYQAEKEAARQAEIQRNFTKFLAMMRAMNMGRTYHTRVNSWKTPEPHRPDGSPMTKPSRASRAAVSHRKSKAARLARVKNR